jgi:hypothetical protein
MKKIIVIIVTLVLSAVTARAAGFLTLGYDYAFIGQNNLLSSGSSRVSYFNIEGGYLFDCGISASLKYDHLGMEDFEYAGQNAKAVAVIPSAGTGYALKFMDDNLLWWINVYAGYAASVRYRQGTNDYKTSGFAPSFSTAVYWRVKGQFYAGVEAGYRYLKVNYSGLAGNPALDLSGTICGISLKHIFE